LHIIRITLKVLAGLLYCNIPGRSQLKLSSTLSGRSFSTSFLSNLVRNTSRSHLFAIAAASGITLLFVSFSLDASNASKVSHVYFGTDTHSIGLFLGAALAVSWIPQNFTTQVSKKAQDFIDGVGFIGFIGILAAFLFIDETQPTLYKIAFPLAGICGAAIIMSVVHPAYPFCACFTKSSISLDRRTFLLHLLVALGYFPSNAP
jgi:peptidoglycan/LPS O-acetylase OafA/YrhL